MSTDPVVWTLDRESYARAPNRDAELFAQMRWTATPRAIQGGMPGDFFVRCTRNEGGLFVQVPAVVLTSSVASSSSSSVTVAWDCELLEDHPAPAFSFLDALADRLAGPLHDHPALHAWFEKSGIARDRLSDFFVRHCPASGDDEDDDCVVPVSGAGDTRVFVLSNGQVASEHRLSERAQWGNPRTPATVILEIAGAEYSAANSIFSWRILVRQVQVNSPTASDLPTLELAPEEDDAPTSSLFSQPVIRPPNQGAATAPNQSAATTPNQSAATAVSPTPPQATTDGLAEVDVCASDQVAPMHLVPRDDIWYAQYKEALQKAREARAIAVSTYLEARRIKDTHLMNYESDPEDDWSEEEEEAEAEEEDAED